MLKNVSGSLMLAELAEELDPLLDLPRLQRLLGHEVDHHGISGAGVEHSLEMRPSPCGTNASGS